jgi:hypothetical protein
MPSIPPSAPDPYKYPKQYAAYERAHGREPPSWCVPESLVLTKEDLDNCRVAVEDCIHQWGWDDMKPTLAKLCWRVESAESELEDKSCA